jgi:hypothetical protein
LKAAYGTEIVDRAVAAVPKLGIVEIAQKVDEYVRADMVKKYGEFAANMAIANAPPGDLVTANIIAKQLALRNASVSSEPAVIKNAVTTGKLAGRKKGKSVLDTKTNIKYPTLGACGRSLATEYGLDPADSWVYYAIRKKDPGRFKELAQ